MLQSVLIFVLGFLSALFLALLVLPSVWRRAVRLTTNSIERAMPITVDEIRASQDQFRARQAVELRRVEIERDDALEKSAVSATESGKYRRRLDRLAAERGDLKERTRLAEEQAGTLQQELSGREQMIAEVASRAREAEKGLAARKIEIDKLTGMYEEASLSSSARQVEIVARDGEVERLSRELTKLRREHSAAMKRIEDANLPDQEEILREAQARVDQLATKLEQAVATISDNEDKIGRREREIARLRERLTAQTSESAGDHGGDEQLRESMQELAADVVRMVSGQSGHKEPISNALNLASTTKGKGRVISLADRIKKRKG